jgi:hypothetical protein
VKVIKTNFSIWYGYRATIPEYKKCMVVVTAGGGVTGYCGLCDVECACFSGLVQFKPENCNREYFAMP